MVAPAGVFSEQPLKALRNYEELTGMGKTVNGLEQVLIEAHDGRIFKLFAAIDTQVWGRFDPEKRAAVIHEKSLPGDDDLIDLAAERALATGASVYFVPSKKIPGGTSAAAILRYAPVLMTTS